MEYSGGMFVTRLAHTDTDMSDEVSLLPAVGTSIWSPYADEATNVYS